MRTKKRLKFNGLKNEKKSTPMSGCRLFVYDWTAYSAAFKISSILIAE